MDENGQEILKAITDKTNSELILFFVIVAVVLVAVMLPMYNMILKDRKAKLEQEKARSENENTRQDKYIEREREIIRVIAANSEVIAGLKATLDISNTAHSDALMRVHSRIDGLAVTTGDLATTLTQTVTTIGEMVRRQVSIAEDIKKVLLIVDNANVLSQAKEGAKTDGV